MIGIVNNINFDRQIESKSYEKFEHVYMHSLHHTFATRCIEKDVKPKVLQKYLGHSNLATTMDLYVHVTADVMHDEIEKLTDKKQASPYLVS